MISKLPGWLNFVILWVIYCFFIFGSMWFYQFMARLLFPYFGMGAFFIPAVAALFAGAYLSKWRERQGGGWRFW